MIKKHSFTATILNAGRGGAYREDFETWSLPDGGMEPGESVAQAAISGRTGSVCVTQEIQMPGAPENLDKQKVYELRDKSGLPRQEFYLQWIEKATLKEEVEVGDVEQDG